MQLRNYKITMKKNLFLLTILFAILPNLNTNGAISYDTKKVTSTDDIVDGGYYLITYQSYYYFIYQKVSDTNNRLHYSANVNGGSDKNSLISTVIEKSNIVKFIKIKDKDNKWLIYDVKSHKYFGISTEGFNYLTPLDSPQEGDTISIGTNTNNAVCIQITTPQKSVYNLAIANSDYEWYSPSSIKNNNKKYYIDLYRINNYSTTLDETQDLPTTTGTTNVSLNISFSNNYYNTLMLPCKITGSYSAVFGTGVKAYSVKSSESDGITFTLVPDADGLQANTPYLIKGTFFNPPFIISNTTIDASSASNGINTVTTGGSTFNGIYKTGIDLGGNKYYVLYNDNFYSCESYKGSSKN